MALLTPPAISLARHTGCGRRTIAWVESIQGPCRSRPVPGRTGAHRPLAAPHRRFPLDAIAEAHRYLEAGGQVGKIVISVTPEAGTPS
ncbi:zinc-binding dehydrogenase [Streptomyces avermitilis]